jgi:hypothetical protein
MVTNVHHTASPAKCTSNGLRRNGGHSKISLSYRKIAYFRHCEATSYQEHATAAEPGPTQWMSSVEMSLANIFGGLSLPPERVSHFYCLELSRPLRSEARIVGRLPNGCPAAFSDGSPSSAKPTVETARTISPVTLLCVALLLLCAFLPGEGTFVPPRVKNRFEQHEGHRCASETGVIPSQISRQRSDPIYVNS